MFISKSICCGYSLESPCRGDSNEYHNIGFYGEITKIIPKLSSHAPLVYSTVEQKWM